MRRWHVLLVSAVAGLAGIVGIHGPSLPAGGEARPEAAASPGGAISEKPRSPGTSGRAIPPGGSRPTNSAGRQSEASPARPGPAVASPSRSATGSAEQYGYGSLAVKVAVRGGKIVSVTVPDLQVADPYSGSIASQVIPLLRQEVLSVQDARINGVSGATYTSEAYAMSLQSALDKLHFK